MFPERLAGPGFTLRMITPADSEAIHAYWRLPEVYEQTSADPWTLDGVTAFTEMNVEGAADGRWCRWGIVPEGSATLVGSIGIVVTEPRHQRGEIGYDLAPAQQGNGLMTRAGAVVLEWALRAGRFHRVEATVMRGNIRSEGVLRRLGFECDAMLRDYKLVRGEWRDFSLWSLISSETLRGK